MEIDQLVDTACERAGSDDLGDDTWREGLDVLVRSLLSEAALNEIGVSDQARQRMQDWWAESSKERSGPQSYRPETFGLDLAAIREQFAFYHDRFDVPVEHQATA